jgi:hypothetical protein
MKHPFAALGLRRTTENPKPKVEPNKVADRW